MAHKNTTFPDSPNEFVFPPSISSGASLTPKCAQFSDETVLDVSHFNESGIVSLGDQWAIGHGETRDGHIDDITPHFDGGELDPKPTRAFIHDLVRNSRSLLGT